MSSSISLSFDKKIVIETLQKNRKEHEEIYNEAVSGYRAKLAEALCEIENLVQNKRDEFGDKKLPEPNLGGNPLYALNTPVNNIKEYDTVLEMLELTSDNTIVLNQSQYNCYMKDNWRWTHDFLMNNSVYSSSAATKLGPMK